MAVVVVVLLARDHITRLEDAAAAIAADRVAIHFR
jgi:hypothetical protein